MKSIINNEIEIDYPDSFYVPEREEMLKYYTTITNRFVIRNAEKHMIISVGWTNPLNLLSSVLVSDKSFLGNCDKNFRRMLKDYKRGENFSCKICGCEANGFAFSYSANDTGAPQNGKTLTVKPGKRIYVLEYVTSGDDRMFCNMAFNMVINSIRLINTESK